MGMRMIKSNEIQSVRSISYRADYENDTYIPVTIFFRIN